MNGTPTGAISRVMFIHSPIFYLYGSYMSKPFNSFEEQIEILKSRNLNFINENAARDILSTYSYYEIINGYKEVGLESDDYFKEGATFEQLYNLFLMDKKLGH